MVPVEISSHVITVERVNFQSQINERCIYLYLYLFTLIDRTSLWWV